LTRRLPALISALLITVSPSAARADVLLTPFAGLSFLDGGSKTTYGASLGLGGLITLEADVARTNLGTISAPVFDLDVHATSFMANAMVRVPVGSVQPYALAGVGLVRLAGAFTLPFEGTLGDSTRSRPAYSLGGGVILYFSPNLGLRGDIRYIRPVGSLRVTDLVNVPATGDVPTGNLDITRATIGLTLKF
jgi:opacity protein-like surface antigen